MNDKELLEAAKRAAFTYADPNDKDMQRYISRWNPLENDRDAFRLAVDLGIFDSFEFKDQSADLLCGHYPSHRRLIVELAAKGFRV